MYVGGRNRKERRRFARATLILDPFGRQLYNLA
jgi:hypothetical protein